MHIRVNDLPACVAPETLGLPTSCAHQTRETAERDVELIRQHHPEATVEIRPEPCPRPLLDRD